MPRKPSRKLLRALCAEVHADDGVNPRDLAKRHREPSKSGHKARQLCVQVAEALGLILADSADDVLRGLIVAGVEPAPDTSRLRVTLGVAASEVDPGEALERLERASGRLRTEVAAAITRRKAPSLTFRLAVRGS